MEKIWKRTLETIYLYDKELNLRTIHRDTGYKSGQIHSAIRQLKSWNLIKTRKVWDLTGRIPRSELRIIIPPSQWKRVRYIFRKK